MPKKGYKMVYDFFEKAFLIPEEWEYPKFNEIVKTNPSTKIESKTVPYIPMDSVDIEKPNFNYTEERLLSENTSLAKFQDNDVLFARITPSTENGKTSFVENFKKKGSVSSELTVLRPSEKVFPKYLYYYMKSHKIRQFAISQMMGTTGRQRVPDFVFKKDLYFELPPLPEQQKIASILSNVDNLIQNTDKLIEKTTRLKKGLMQELLTRGIGHTKFKKVKWLFGKEIDMPEEWEVTNLKNLVKSEKFAIVDGPFGTQLHSEDYQKDGIPLMNVNNITKEGKFNYENIVFISLEKFKELDRSKIIPGDLLLAKTGATIGKITIFPNKWKEGLISSRCAKITLDPIKASNYYVFYFLFSKFGFSQIISQATATTMPGINLKDISKLKIIFPINVKEQQKIASILSNTDERIQSYGRYKEKLQRLKRSLIQKLLTGEVRVAV